MPTKFNDIAVSINWTHKAKAVLSLFVVIVLSYAVRAYMMGWHGLNDVEAQTVALAKLPTLTQLLQECMRDGNPPLFHLLVRTWSFIFGWTDLSLKILALLISGSLPVIVYWLVSRRLNSQVAGLAAFFIVFCPTLIMNSNMVRPYALMAMFAILSTEQLYCLFVCPQSKKHFAAYCLLVILMLYSHILCASVVLSHACFVFLRPSLFRGQPTKTWIKAILIVLLAYLPWILSQKLVIEETSALWRNDIDFQTILLLVVYSTANLIRELMKQNTGPFIFALAVYVVAFSSILSSSTRRHNWLCLFYSVGLANLVLLTFLLNQFAHIFSARHISHEIIFVFLLLAIAIDQNATKWSKILGYGAAILVCLMFWIPQLGEAKTIADGCMYQAVKMIVPNSDKSKDLVVCAYEVYTSECERQLPQGFHLITFPDLNHVEYVVFPGLRARLADRQAYTNIEKVMADVLKNGGKVWLIEHQTAQSGQRGKRLYDFSDDPKLALETLELISGERLRVWLSFHAKLAAPANYFSSVPTCLAVRSFIPICNEQ